MKVRFLETVTVQAVDGETFVAGQVYDLPEPSAQRWVLRKKAEIADAKKDVTQKQSTDKKA